jgi:hypothetical protein
LFAIEREALATSRNEPVPPEYARRRDQVNQAPSRLGRCRVRRDVNLPPAGPWPRGLINIRAKPSPVTLASRAAGRPSSPPHALSLRWLPSKEGRPFLIPIWPGGCLPAVFLPGPPGRNRQLDGRFYLNAEVRRTLIEHPQKLFDFVLQLLASFAHAIQTLRPSHRRSMVERVRRAGLPATQFQFASQRYDPTIPHRRIVAGKAASS